MAPEPTTAGESSSADTGENGKPSLADLQGQACPTCTTGVLYVAVYDPEALYEQGQTIRAGRSYSGGSYHVRCLHCGHTESRPMDAQVAVAPTTTVEGG